MIQSLEKKELIEKRKKYFSPSLKTSYEIPIQFIRGKYQYLYDENNVEYLGLCEKNSKWSRCLQ
jgi:4-aminobutyrate aminotransferase-like enzyme